MSRKIYILIVCTLISLGVYAQQSAVTPKKFFNIQKVVIPAILQVEDGSVYFEDTDGNQTINAQEVCYIHMKVKNVGRGDGYGCQAVIRATGTVDGISTSNQNLSAIKPGETREIKFPISTSRLTKDGEVRFTIQVTEPNGFGTEEQTLVIATHEFDAPNVQIVSYKLHGNASGVLKRRDIFSLQVMVQNTAHGKAEQVRFDIHFPEHISWIGGDMQRIDINTLEPGETKIFEFELAASANAADVVTIPIKLSEKYGLYAKGTDVVLKFGQTISGKDIVVESHQEERKEIQKGSLISDVDDNIPVTNVKNNNTFALIIANEKYHSVGNVAYALNDGSIFKKYCEQTLGIDSKKIHYLPNATGNQIKTEINWLQNVLSVFDNANIIFYYAGHGLPDESNRTSYFMPIDGVPQDLSTCYKLDDLYTLLADMQAKQVVIFMDACFSGSNRGDGMLYSARGVALKSKPGQPQGNMVVFSAAQGDETAYPYAAQQHGMFTYFLLKKLQETKGDVTCEEIANYITTKVKQQSILENNKSQTPCITPAADVATEWKSWKLR